MHCRRLSGLCERLQLVQLRFHVVHHVDCGSPNVQLHEPLEVSLDLEREVDGAAHGCAHGVHKDFGLARVQELATTVQLSFEVGRGVDVDVRLPPRESCRLPLPKLVLVRIELWPSARPVGAGGRVHRALEDATEGSDRIEKQCSSSRGSQY